MDIPDVLEDRLLRTLADSFFRRKYDHAGDLTPILDYVVASPDRGTCFDLYWEIFIQNDYLFDGATDRPVIIDCGSNIGMSVLYFKHFYPDAYIIAFEPDPDAFRYLERNIELNGLREVTLEQKAVWRREGPVTLFREARRPGSPRSSMVRRGETWRPYTVEAVPVSRYIDGPVDFLKLDVEGAEEAVLTDLTQTGRIRNIDQMVIEYHHHERYGLKEDRLSELLGVLEKEGFGYVLETWRQKRPLRRGAYQDILIYAYRKSEECLEETREGGIGSSTGTGAELRW